MTSLSASFSRHPKQCIDLKPMAALCDLVIVGQVNYVRFLLLGFLLEPVALFVGAGI
jgi:hypothetical protein